MQSSSRGNEPAWFWADSAMDQVQSRLAAEQRARGLIDAQLEAPGWSVQDRNDLDLIHHTGVAVREASVAPGHGRADYLLCVNRQAVCVIEAKPVGTPLSGALWRARANMSRA